MKRPYELLPLDFPKDHDPGPDYFYKIASQFIPDMIRMMSEGLHVDKDAVDELKRTVDTVLENVAQTLSENKVIADFQKSQVPFAQKKHAEKAMQAVREPKFYLKPFSKKNAVHRTWAVNTYLISKGKESAVQDKWSIKDVKSYNTFLEAPFLANIIDKTVDETNPIAIAGMERLAEYQAELWNRPRKEKAAEPVPVHPFNPGSSKQITELFEYLKIPAVNFSAKTGNASWDRKQIEEVLYNTTDPELMKVLQAIIDYSFGAIIKNNFLKAFDTFTIDGILHGNVKLFGAKTFRNTSNSPNLLNAPSTNSAYAKPLKKCFIAKDDFVIYTADLSALEDRVIANLSDDTNKCNIFLEGLDGHSLNACGYFRPQVERLLGKQGNDVDLVKAFMQEHDNKNKIISDLRQDSKAPTFKLAYGGYPDSHKGGVITPDIFDNYHNVLYPGITRYREEYVLKTARKQGYIHLGLGCRIYTSDAEQDIRTLHNATVQFWSILTLIAINEFNYLIDKEGLSGDIQVQSTIYDSIYAQVRRDPEVIKWTNDTLIELMCAPYLKTQTIPNAAEGEIGLNWCDLNKISNNASIEEITQVMSKF